MTARVLCATRRWVAVFVAGSKKLENSISTTESLRDFCVFRFGSKKGRGQVNLVFKF